MPLETGTYISDLVATNPLGTDDASLGDDHLRLIKLVLKNTFPSITGPVTLTQDSLNAVIVSLTGENVLTISRMMYDITAKALGYTASDGTWRLLQPYGDYQAAGDYATNTALTSEVNARIAADTSLQGQVDDRVLRAGDTMTGLLTSSGSGGGFVSLMAPASPNTGDYVNYTGFASVADGRGGELYFQLQEHVGTNFRALISLKGNDGTVRYFYIPQGSPMHDSDYGDVAYTNDLAAYQPKGSYVTTDAYSSDFSTTDSRVINLAYGHRIQAFQATVGDGTTAGTWITFPVAFSGTPVFYQANSCGNGDDVTDTDYWCYGATSTGMYVRPRNHQGAANIIVIGPK